jgi:hypothetical protein
MITIRMGESGRFLKYILPAKSTPPISKKIDEMGEAGQTII